MMQRSSLAAIGLCLMALATGCPNNDEAGSAAPSAANTSEKPGWLTDRDREIIRLQLELAVGEPSAEARLKSIAGTLAELEKGRLPNSWTETAFIVSKASVPIGAKTMWKTLSHKDDVEPLLDATCKGGQDGLANIQKMMDHMKKGDRLARFRELMFSTCQVKEIGFLEDVGSSQHDALGFAAVAFNHLKSNQTLSPEEANALRMFVRYFSEYAATKTVIRRPLPAPSVSASEAPSATTTPSATKKNPAP